MRLLRGLLAVAYPLVIFGGLQMLEPRWVALGLATLFALRGATRGRRPTAEELRRVLKPALFVGFVFLATIWLNDPRFLLLVPVLVSAALLFAFGRTLFDETPLVETFARMKHPDLNEREIRHCRRVTFLWCGFFAANGAVAAWLAVSGDLWAWTVYTGLIAYILMGVLFAGEFVVRAWRFGRYEGTLVEPICRRLFPPGPLT